VTDLDDLSERELLEAIGAEISYTNQLLEQQNTLLKALVEPDSDETPMYECDLCGEKIKEDNRESHMQKSHGLPSGVSFEGKYSEP